MHQRPVSFCVGQNSPCVRRSHEFLTSPAATAPFQMSTSTCCRRTRVLRDGLGVPCLVLTLIQCDEAAQVVAFDFAVARISCRDKPGVEPVSGALAIPSPPKQQPERVVREGEPQVVALCMSSVAHRANPICSSG